MPPDGESAVINIPAYAVKQTLRLDTVIVGVMHNTVSPSSRHTFVIVKKDDRSLRCMMF